MFTRLMCYFSQIFLLCPSLYFQVQLLYNTLFSHFKIFILNFSKVGKCDIDRSLTKPFIYWEAYLSIFYHFMSLWCPLGRVVQNEKMFENWWSPGEIVCSSSKYSDTQNFFEIHQHLTPSHYQSLFYIGQRGKKGIKLDYLWSFTPGCYKNVHSELFILKNITL